ncbi:MAG: 3-isopropylmalate dehydratase small subunit [Deltaproteobacteria bacterium]|nr:3-isopropylmalate dehydratase small subunit [Deltaproteobacteria bacterium]
MEPFKTLTAVAVPLNRVNVDTDAIIPKQFLKSIERTGFGKHLFHSWRYLDEAGTQSNPDFILNRPSYRGAGILVTGDNFGCGSSREHAPWALTDYGIRCVISSSFADIFFNNSIKNGLLPAVVNPADLEALLKELEAHPGQALRVDLKEQVISTEQGLSLRFAINADNKHSLLNGLDDIGRTLQHLPEIEAYEARHRKDPSWA